MILALNMFTDVLDHIQPYQQKELLRLVLHKAILAPDSMKMALYGRQPETELFSPCESAVRSQTPTWLPGLVSQSVLLWDQSRIEMKRVARGHMRISLIRGQAPPPGSVSSLVSHVR